ncbi:MAG: oligopeptide transporter, OPT family, partial [Candidatus Aminicenantes bacterium]|nr:oligopeptide transporter, OPT family [Candidatus Aminicenantes bacterium]
MKEFTLRAILIGLVLTVILGAANAYLGLRAGMTIAATYPAAVIGMAVLRIMKGSILEENIARTIGSIGESIAAGAIFTIPAFVIAGAWSNFNTFDAYIKSTALMFVGGLLGIMFVTFLRRVMVSDPDLVFPESVAAAEIHKAGQKGSQGSRFLFQAMGLGALLYSLGVVQVFAASKDFLLKVGKLGSSFVRLGAAKDAPTIGAGGTVAVSGPGIYPAYIGVGYIIGPRLASLNFAGGVLAWGLFAPLLMFFLGPDLIPTFYGPGVAAADVSWPDMVTNVWKFIIRPIAVGGMLVGAGFTLYRMRKNLGAGLKRSLGDVKKAAGQAETTSRIEKDLNIKVVLLGLLATFVLMVFVYKIFAGTWPPAILAAAVMAVAGFFFAAVSGNLVGTIGSSNNPISGLTLSTLIIAALLMVLVGATGVSGVAAVLGVAAVVCVSSAVAGEMLQDLKVGHIFGEGPDRCGEIEVTDIGLAGGDPELRLCEEADAPAPARARAAHKWSAGAVLVVGGSPGISGAAALAGRAALHFGAGYVRLACPGALQAALAAADPTLTTVAIGSGQRFGTTSAPAVLAAAERFDVMALGPGLGTG